jgi:tol-pal system protein YbgF
MGAEQARGIRDPEHGRSLSRTAGLVVLAALAAAGCATKGDVAELQAGMFAEMETGRAQQDSLLYEIRQLRAVLLDSLGVQERRGLSGRVDLQRQIQDLNIQLDRLMQLTGEVQRRLAMQDGMDRGPISDPESTAPDSGGDGGPTAGAAGDPAALYETAMRQFRRESYTTARVAFDEFLQRYPAHERAPDAQYFRAESYDRVGEVDVALAEYARVLELYPNSARAPSALYRSGLIEAERGNADDARTFFTRVVQAFPDSDEATPAREELRKLGG